MLAHGADPTLKNQEGQTPLDLVSVSDGLFETQKVQVTCIKCLHGFSPNLNLESFGVVIKIISQLLYTLDMGKTAVGK